VRPKRLVAAGALVLGIAGAALGTAFATHSFHQVVDASWAGAYPSYEEMTQHADAVVRGHVVAENGSEVSPQAASLVYTNFEFQVDKWIAGPPAAKGILLHQMGGSHGLTSSEIRDDPPLRVGEKDILFLKMYEPGKYFVLGGPTGRFIVRDDGTVKNLPGGLIRVAEPQPSVETRLARIAAIQGKTS